MTDLTPIQRVQHATNALDTRLIELATSLRETAAAPARTGLPLPLLGIGVAAAWALSNTLKKPALRQGAAFVMRHLLTQI